MDMNFLPSGSLLSAFLLASLVLAIIPGPAVLYIVTRSLVQGRRSGLTSVVGVALGNLGNAIGASLGLAALFAVSSVAFTVVKYAGAAYLVYLGVQALRAPAPETRAEARRPVRLQRIFRDGFLVALLNPKTAVFFAAFLPQFMDPALPTIPQGFVLGALFVGIAGITDTAYALTASTVAPVLTRAGRLRAAGRYLSGGTFIGLGVLTAFGGPRTQGK